MGVEPHPDAGRESREEPVEQPQQSLLHDQLPFATLAEIAEGHAAQGHGEGLGSGVARLAGQPGRKAARTTMRSSVSWKTPTTAAATKQVRRFSCSQGCRERRLRARGVESRSPSSTPDHLPAWALISMARASKRLLSAHLS